MFTNSCGTSTTAAAGLSVGNGVNFPKDLEGTVGCAAGSTTLKTRITGGVGLTGTLTYAWERSADNLNWSVIPGTTETHPTSGTYEPSYTPTSSELNYWFRLAVNNNGCITYTNASKVIINEKPVVNQPANVQACNNGTVPAITFTGTPSGTTFSWTNDNTAIGLGASGTGNIPSFTATNNTGVYYCNKYD
jgi:hypothetical protein